MLNTNSYCYFSQKMNRYHKAKKRLLKNSSQWSIKWWQSWAKSTNTIFFFFCCCCCGSQNSIRLLFGHIIWDTILSMIWSNNSTKVKKMTDKVGYKLNQAIVCWVNMQTSVFVYTTFFLVISNARKAWPFLLLLKEIIKKG